MKLTWFSLLSFALMLSLALVFLLVLYTTALFIATRGHFVGGRFVFLFLFALVLLFRVVFFLMALPSLRILFVTFSTLACLALSLDTAFGRFGPLLKRP